MMAGPGVPKGRTVDGRVSLIDVAPTVLRLLGVAPLDADGIDLRAGPERRADAAAGSLRRILRAAARLRLEPAARDLVGNLEVHRGAEARALRPRPGSGRDARCRPDRRPARGCSAGAGDPVLRPGRHRPSPTSIRRRGRGSWRWATRPAPASPAGASRPDPKDRREEAARLAQVISGELQGRALERALRDILADDRAESASAICASATCCSTAAAAARRRRTSDPRLPRACRRRTHTSGWRRARPRSAGSMRRPRRCATPSASNPAIRS